MIVSGQVGEEGEVMAVEMYKVTIEACFFQKIFKRTLGLERGDDYGVPPCGDVSMRAFAGRGISTHASRRS